VILCRLDAGFLAVAIGVAGLLHVLRAPERRGPLRLLVMVVLGTCVLVMPYLLFNLSQFGSPIPISGRLESTFPHTDFRKIMDGLSSLGKVRQVVLVLAIVYWVWRIIFARSTPSNTPALPQSIRFALDVLAVTCLFHAFNEVLFMRWRLYWHFVLLVPFFALLVSGGVDSVLSRISTSSQRVVLLVFCLGVLFEGAYAVRRVTSRRPGQCWRQAMYEASLWIRANTAGTDRIAAATPEIVGFFSGRGAVDLSGLCNNLGIQKAMDSQSLGPYLRASGVKYIFYSKAIDKSHGAGYQPFDLRFDSDYFGTRSELIHFSQSEEVYRSPPASDWGGVPTVFVLWRWR
jgi:hypothetical protein